MAVEARRLSFFPSQLMPKREMMSTIDGSTNVFNSFAIGYGAPPLSGTTTETLLPIYNSAIVDSALAKAAVKAADSDLTHNLPVSRKRSRDSVYPFTSFPCAEEMQSNNRCDPFTFLGEDISLQIQQQQLEIDRMVAQHTEKVRLGLDDRRKKHAMRIITAVEEGIMKTLRAKEAEIEKIGKLNWALEERVKSLCIENQIWRDLAQTNEATANVLRSNLEHVLAQVRDEQQNHHQNQGIALDEAAALMDDAQSCCGSNFDVAERRMLAGGGPGGERKGVMDGDRNDGSSAGNSSNVYRLCRSCGEEESCVLLLPCRHLCLCTVCGSSVHTCPVCKSVKNASLHVNFSS